MLQWQPQQLETLKALGLKRFLLRADLNRPQPSSPAIAWEALLAATEKDTAPPPAVIEKSSPHFESNAAIYCDERYTLLRHEALQFDWLLPALAGFADDLRILHRDDEALFLLALKQSGWAHEAAVLAELFAQKVNTPDGHRVPQLTLQKTTVVLGAIPEFIATEAVQAIHHPAYIQHYPAQKRFWWQQLLALQNKEKA